MEPEEEAPPAPLPDILPETGPEAAPPSPGTPLIEPDMEPDMLPEPDVTDEELGAMEELDEGLEDELPELPQQPANSAATSTSARVRTKVFLGKIQTPFRLPADARAARGKVIVNCRSGSLPQRAPPAAPVSQRRMRGPRPICTHPASRAAAASSGEKPPSLPVMRPMVSAPPSRLSNGSPPAS